MFIHGHMAWLSHWPLVFVTRIGVATTTTRIQSVRQFSYVSRWQAKFNSSNILVCSQCHSLKPFKQLVAYYSRSSQVTQPNYYNILGVSSNATPAVIKMRYYKLCFEFHPDRLNAQYTSIKPTAEAQELAARMAKKKFQQISEAYRVIGHPVRRREYDHRMLSGSGRSDGGGDMATGQSGYSSFKRTRPSETERRRWQEATRPVYRTQSGDELRNKMWRRSNWLYESKHNNNNSNNNNNNNNASRFKIQTDTRTSNGLDDRIIFKQANTRFRDTTAHKIVEKLNYRVKLREEESIFLRRAAEVSILLTVPILGAAVVFGVMSHVHADANE
jgi:curved DNA-binding protein CbpA